MIDRKKTILFLIVASLVCLASSIVLPSWSQSGRWDNQGEIVIGWDQYVNTYSVGTSSFTGGSNSIEIISSLHGTELLAMSLFFILSILAVIMTGYALVRRVKTMTEMDGKYLGVDILIPSLISLTTPFVFIILWSKAETENSLFSYGIFGTWSSGYYSISWGPNIGWYLQLSAFVMLMIAFILTRLNFTSKEKMEWSN